MTSPLWWYTFRDVRESETRKAPDMAPKTSPAKLAATVAMQAQHYTDIEIAKLHAEIVKLQSELAKDVKAGARTKFFAHCLTIVFGLTISFVAIKITANPFIGTGVATLPNVIVEIIDRVKML